MLKSLDDYDVMLFADIHEDLYRTFSLTSYILEKMPIEIKLDINPDTLKELYDAICDYDGNDVASLPLKYLISQQIGYPKKEAIREIAFKDVLSTIDTVRKAAEKTIYLLAKSKVSMQDAITTITGRTRSLNCASTYLNLLSVLVHLNFIGDKRRADLALVLEDIYNSMNDDSIEGKDKIDAAHNANVLAGCCSTNTFLMENKRLSSVVKKWDEYSKDENNFNDVRFGFEQGVNTCF